MRISIADVAGEYEHAMKAFPVESLGFLRNHLKNVRECPRTASKDILYFLPVMRSVACRVSEITDSARHLIPAHRFCLPSLRSSGPADGFSGQTTL